jgi:ABC-2 type transport system ATP-binding protein
MPEAVSIHDLSKTYKGGTAALKGVDLSVAEGDFFALLGPNGAGKTTLIGILTGLVVKSGGEAKVFGHPVDREAVQAKVNIGLVPQEFNFNVFEKVINIVLDQAGYYGIPRAEALRRAEPILKNLGLWDKRNEVSQKLSGGMKRRLLIARALIHHPRLLVLDEPTAGVDVELRRHMWEFLRRINKEGTTIILTTHYLEEAEQLCRTVAVINKGKIVTNETMESLLKRHGEKKLEDIYLSLIEEPPQTI